MSDSHADRNLLYGILALQLKFINDQRLVEATNAWIGDKSKLLGEILIAQGAISRDVHSILESLVEKHLELHGQNARESLAQFDGVPEQVKEHWAAAEPRAHDQDKKQDDKHDGNHPPEPTALMPTEELVLPRFEKVRLHAEGGLGEVYVAIDRELNREVALKAIKLRHADKPSYRQRFIMEAEITGRLDHPGVVPIYSLTIDSSGRPAYAMRLVRGKTLAKVVREFQDTEYSDSQLRQRRLELRRLLQHFVDVCETVHYAHSQGILHRDLKPDNILIGEFGETSVVDWGIAKVLRSSPRDGDLPTDSQPQIAPLPATQAGSFYGTPGYASPEQVSGKTDLLGPASDVFSLGCVLYFLLSGQHPFESNQVDSEEKLRETLEKVRSGKYEPLRSGNTDVPAELTDICEQAMANALGERYESAQQLARVIEQWLADEPISRLKATASYFEKEHQAAPQVSEYAERYGRELANLAMVFVATGRFAEAIEFAESSVRVLNTIRIDHDPPLRHRVRQELFYARLHQINALMALGRTSEAEQLRAEEDQELQQLKSKAEQDKDLMSDLLSMTLHRGWSLDQIERELGPDAIAPKQSDEASESDEFGAVDPFDTGYGFDEGGGVGIDDGLDTVDSSPGSINESDQQAEFERLAPQEGYRIVQQLARTGFADIYLAVDRVLGRHLAIKVQRSPVHSDQTDTLLNEAQLLSRLSHPHIPPIFSAGETREGNSYLTMPVFDNMTFAEWSRAERLASDYVKELGTAALWLSQVCDALHYVHQLGVLHLDPKPANIFLLNGTAFLGDWSLSTRRRDAPVAAMLDDWQGLISEEGQVVGTPIYMSPEQIRANPKDLGPHTDIYILGCCLYQALTGAPPFQTNEMMTLMRAKLDGEAATPIRKLQPKAPKQLVRICEKAMAFEVSDRYATADEMRQDLLKWRGR